MADASKATSRSVEMALRSVLGADRVLGLKHMLLQNSDGQPVVHIEVVYDASTGITQSEMDRVYEELWSEGMAVDAPFPIIDFKENTDVGPVAAE